ncbi:MAG: hypothetical protein QM607_04160 [Microbacterium sp.]
MAQSGAESSRKALIVGSTLALLIGASIMVLLHESSHAVADALLGCTPTQVPFAVDCTPELAPDDGAIVAITGPIFSLALGLIGFAVDRIAKPLRAHPFWCLVWLWTIFLSIEEGVGYFVIVGLVPAGDTAVAYAAWGAPVWVYIVSTSLGIAAMFGTGWLFSRPLIDLTTTMSERNDLSFWPWIAGTLGFGVLTTIYMLLTPGIDGGAIAAVLFGIPGMAVFAPISLMFGGKRFEAAAPIRMGGVTGGIILLCVLIVVNVTLTRGRLWG